MMLQIKKPHHSDPYIRHSYIGDVERYSFLQDALALFRKERHGHMGIWHYSDALGLRDPVHGSDLWSKFVSGSKNYYLLSSEIELLQTRLKSIVSPSLQSTTLVDFGPGSAQAVRAKTFPIINALRNVNAYCPIDCSAVFIDEACSAVSMEFPSISIDPCFGDYTREQIALPKFNISRFGIFMGGSISNMEGHPNDRDHTERVIKQLKTFKEILGEHSQMLFTYDANQDERSIYNSYMHPAQIEFGRNIMQRIYRDLPVSQGYNPLAWQYEPVWYSKTHQLCHTITAQEDMSFILGREEFHIKIGETYIVDNSFKYPQEVMRDYMSDAGWMSEAHIADHQGRVIVQLMHS